ncbi:MAG: NAD-dependent epimerase/dehydratase family protein, partial [Candidatus Hadarchaeota archaeon]|nr:NAD-dependent epimerase/dehydratase family protein [Candidatus Hadarchaeota archaeon]
ITVLDNLSSGNLENLAKHKDDPKFSSVRGDITNVRDVQKSLEDVDIVIHEAAITSVPLSIKKPDLVNKVNVGGTKTLLEESAKADVKRFVYASSCAVYGEADELPIREGEKTNPISPYGKSKLAGETQCKSFHDEQGLETVCLRYFNVYGPRQTFGPYAGVILQFLERVNNNKPPIIFGDGKQTRDFVYVSDVARGSLLALEMDRAAGQVINIGTGTATSVNQLCGTILKTLGRADLEPVHEDPKPGDIRQSRADISKAKKILGYRPEIKLEEGIKSLIKHKGLYGG